MLGTKKWHGKETTKSSPNDTRDRRRIVKSYDMAPEGFTKTTRKWNYMIAVRESRKYKMETNRDSFVFS